jgi:hypothetical protein
MLEFKYKKGNVLMILALYLEGGTQANVFLLDLTKMISTYTKDFCEMKIALICLI